MEIYANNRIHDTRRSEKPLHRAPQEKGRNPYDGLRPWSAITHGIGAVLAIIGTFLLLTKTAKSDQNIRYFISFLIYGLSMIGLYTASTLYHCVNCSVSGRIALRKFDHISIYLLIAGSYTPICLLELRGTLGWTLFIVIWALALLGTAMALLWINCPRQLTATVYIVMGWLAVIALIPIRQAMGSLGLFWLLLGGILYTVGGILYALKWPGRSNPRFGCHEVFHVFILLGSIAHFLLMYHVIV